MRQENESVKPEKNFKIGAVRVAVWKNVHTTREGKSFEIKKVVLDRTYKDSNGEFKNTNSIDLNDIPKAILALTRAYEYLATKQGEEASDDSS